MSDRDRDRAAREGERERGGDSQHTNDIVREYRTGMEVADLAHRYHRSRRATSRLLRQAQLHGTLQLDPAEARRTRPSPAHLRRSGLAVRPAALPAARWAYIAGLLDGEGSIVARGQPGQAHQRFTISIVQKEPLPLQWMRDAVGVGDIFFAGGTHRYQIQAQRPVFEFLLAVERYLVVKRTEAHSALASLATSYGWVWQQQQPYP